MRGKRNFQKSVTTLKDGSQPKRVTYNGSLGIYQGSVQVVEVPGRRGFVWVRLRNSYNEVIQAYCTDVAPVFDLPVVVERDSTNQTRYRVVSRDVGRYQDWGNVSPYLGTHGSSHSFSSSGGGDIVWVHTPQIVYFMAQPSGTVGSMSVYVNEGVYNDGTNFRHAGGTGVAISSTLKPTGTSQARMVLLYMNKVSGNFTVLGGSYFTDSITGTSQLVQYIPSVPASNNVPIAAIRLVTGTAGILWANIIDVRPWLGLGNF